MQEIVIGKDRVSLAGLIGKGGEGEVYAIKERSGQAAKIYSTNLRTKREDKVRAMVSKRLSAKTNLVAYPNEIVTDLRGNFLGFVMPLVSGYHPLHELYNPKSRRRQFPRADYRFLVRAAQNVARAVGKVHQAECVIGDLNHSGVLVAQNATVALIDADSFQFSSDGKFYPCEVGVRDYTPPEIQGKSLASVQRITEHDNFGLAVAIFHLLFMGHHPYAGRNEGSDISLGEAIAQNRFAFSLTRQSKTRTLPPDGALTLDLFPDAIIHSFEAAFGLKPEIRPRARDWIHALNELARTLKRCTYAQTHFYPSTVRSCVWCKLAWQRGVQMFPAKSEAIPDIPTDTLGTEQAIQEILAFRFPSAAHILPSTAMPTGASSALHRAQADKRRRTFLSLLKMGVGVLMMVGASAAVIGIVEPTPAWRNMGGFLAVVGVTSNIVGIILILMGWHNLADQTIETGPFLQAFKDADEQVQRELDEFVRRNDLTEAIKVRGDADAAITAYKDQDRALDNELRVLESNREVRRRQIYLDRFSIRRANISGIGTAEINELNSYGIETAADIDRPALHKVPGLDNDMKSQLLDWRRRRESRFRYDPTPNAQDVADERALRSQFAAEKAKLESAIRNGLGALRNARASLDALPARARGNAALNRALEFRAQAARDLELLGVSVPASTVTITFQPPASPVPQHPKAPRVVTPKKTRSSMKSYSSPNCPRCGSQMVRRTARRGRNPGSQFWGCSRFPRCRGTRN